MSSDVVARRLVVHGRVQGVFFRQSSRDVASQAGVTGWVVNRPDRRVELWLEGPQEAVDGVESWVRNGGPPTARVRQVDATDVRPAGHRAFEIRHG